MDNWLWLFNKDQLLCHSEHFLHINTSQVAQWLMAGSLQREHVADSFAFFWIAIISSIFLMKWLLVKSAISWFDLRVNSERHVGHGNVSMVLSPPRRRSTYFPKQHTFKTLICFYCSQREKQGNLDVFLTTSNLNSLLKLLIGNINVIITPEASAKVALAQELCSEHKVLLKTN